jgi:hypothetical protein
VRDLIREVAGFALYKRRVQELLRFGKEKRCIGSYDLAKRKREVMRKKAASNCCTLSM